MTTAEEHAVLFLEDLARELRCSKRTIQLRIQRGTFPIPALPSIDKRPRWARQAVARYLDGHEDRPIHRRKRS